MFSGVAFAAPAAARATPAGGQEEIAMATGSSGRWFARRIAPALPLGAALLVSAALIPAGGIAQEATPPAALLSEIGNDGVLTNCVDPSFPPMEYYESADSKTPIGFDIDLMTEVGKRIGVKVEEQPMEFTGLLPALQGGRCDTVASGLYLTEQRLQTFDAQPYYDTSVVLMTRADNDTIKSPEDLSGKTVAVQSGTNYLNVLNDLNAKLKAEGKPEATLQTYPKQTDAIQQLVVGRADATISQDTEFAFRERAQPGQFKIAYTYPTPQTFGIYHRKDSPALAAALKSAIEAMRDDGTTAKIADTWKLPEAGVKYTTEIYGATPVATPQP
jgi:polar amino acid transport system substrate-binding protein